MTYECLWLNSVMSLIVELCLDKGFKVILEVRRLIFWSPIKGITIWFLYLWNLANDLLSEGINHLVILLINLNSEVRDNFSWLF